MKNKKAAVIAGSDTAGESVVVVAASAGKAEPAVSSGPAA